MGPWPKVIEHPKLEILSETNREQFIQRRVCVEIAPGQTSEGWLLLPSDKGPFPAVLVVYYEPETSVGLNPKQPLRDYALQLTRRGFVTLSIGTTGRQCVEAGDRCGHLPAAFVSRLCRGELLARDGEPPAS